MASSKDRILVIGSSGQVGTELVVKLRELYGADNVIATDIRDSNGMLKEGGPFEVLDVLDSQALSSTIDKYQVTQVYLLAALLSAVAEQKMQAAWNLNIQGLFNILELAREGRLRKVFWPSSIAVFGPTTPQGHTPQYTIMEPGTVYGISKLAGERWCEYYFNKYGVDVRSVRYPGIIGCKSMPGGGTTDYAVHIFHNAIKDNRFKCFLREDTTLPMMYMPDAIKATVGLMETDTDKVKIRSSYNVAGMSFSPSDIVAEIQKHIPEFICDYEPDYRQAIADGWPMAINDMEARNDWGWQPDYNLQKMTDDMLKNLAVDA